MKIRPEMDKLTLRERVVFALSVTKYALVSATSYDLNEGKQKAVDVTLFRKACAEFASEISGLPESMMTFIEELRQRS